MQTPLIPLNVDLAAFRSRFPGVDIVNPRRLKSAFIAMKTRTVDLASPEFYVNRELSLLEFNQRVLEQAKDTTLPLLERLFFLCIFSRNLDEFFEIGCRVSRSGSRSDYSSPDRTECRQRPFWPHSARRLTAWSMSNTRVSTAICYPRSKTRAFIFSRENPPAYRPTRRRAAARTRNRERHGQTAGRGSLGAISERDGIMP